MRSSLEARGKELTGPWRILDVTGRRGSVEAAIAAMSSPDAEAGGLVGRQLDLFSLIGGGEGAAPFAPYDVGCAIDVDR